MRLLRNALLAAAGVTLVASAAYAASAKTHVMQVALPDGSVATVHYVGDVAPRVVVSADGAGPALAPMGFAPDAAASDPFAVDPIMASFDGLFAALQRQNAQMVHEAASMEQAALAHGHAGQSRQPGFAVASDTTPADGARNYSYSMVTTTSANGCTRTVEWSSNGAPGKATPKATSATAGMGAGAADGQPRMWQTASAQCGAQATQAPSAMTSTAAVAPASSGVQGEHRT